METLYRIVFAGELVPGEPQQQVIDAFAARFRVREETAREIIRGGGRTVLKHDLNQAEAERYRVALAKVGLLVQLEPQDPLPVVGDAMAADPSIDLNHREALPRIPDPEDTSGLDVSTEPPDDRQRCPKCGAREVAPLTGVCQACGVVVERYLARQGLQTSGAAGVGLDNPYTPPAADLTPPPASGIDDELRAPRGVAAGRGWGWVAEGWDLFKDAPWAWIGAVLLYVLISIALNLIPFVGGLTMSILGPIFTGGLMIGAHAQHAGERFEVKHLFAGFSRNPGPLALIGVATLGFVILFMLILVLIGMGAAFTLANSGHPAGVASSPADLGQLEPLTLLLPVLIALLFTIPLTMALLFAPPLVALNDVPVLRAFTLSFQGCWRNILPFLVFGLVSLLLGLASLLTLGLGLLVVMPVLTIAVYCAYRDIFYR